MPFSVFELLKKPSVAAVLAILPVSLLIGLGSVRPGGQALGAIRHGIGSGAVHFNDSIRLEKLARPFVAGTKYEGQINVTKPPLPGFLNLYSVDPSLLGLPQLACNCAYVGDEIVACDRAFLDTFSSAINFGVRDEQLSDTFSQLDHTFESWLGAWIVGHEIGHAVLHAGIIGARPAMASRELAARLENEADRFFAERVPSEHSQRASFAITTFAFQMFSATYVPGEGSDSGSVVRGTAHQVHQPWLIRALDVARVISEISSGAGSGEDFFGRLRSKVRLEVDGIDVGTFCDRSSLRSRVDAAMERRKNRVFSR